MSRQLMLYLLILIGLFIRDTIQLECDLICVECGIATDYLIYKKKGECIQECELLYQDGQDWLGSLNNSCVSFGADSISISGLSIKSQLMPRSLMINQISQVNLYNLTISDVIESQCSSMIRQLIIIKNVNTVVVHNLNVVNSKNLPTIINVFSFSALAFLQKVNVSGSSLCSESPLVQLSNGKSVQIRNVITLDSSASVLQTAIANEQSYYGKFNAGNKLETPVVPIYSALIKANGVASVNVQDVKFVNNIRLKFLECLNYYYSYDLQGMITINSTNTSMQNVNATKNQLSNVFTSNSGENYILKSTFIENTCDWCQGSVFNFISASIISMISSTFQKNLSLDGGSVYIKDSICGTDNINNSTCILVSACQFIANSAIASGGAILLDNSDINFQSSVPTLFMNNRAKIGGAIRYVNRLPKYFQKYSEDALFNINYNDNPKQLIVFNNTADMWGKNIGSYPRDFKIDYSNPIEKYSGSSEGEEKNCLKRTEESTLIREFAISNIRSGQILNMKVIFLDEEFYPIVIDATAEYPLSIKLEIQEFQIVIERENNLMEIDGDYFKKFEEIQNGIFVFDNLQVYVKPETVENVILKTNIIRIPRSDYTYASFQEMRMRVEIGFRSCKQGEIYSKYQNGTIYYCDPCDFGKYSLDVPEIDNPKQICKLCPENTVGCMENLIVLKDGYWRRDNNSDTIVQCYNNEDNCIGQNIDNIDLCVEGHTGPLCELCDTSGSLWGSRYVMDKSYSCTTCKEKGPGEIAKALLMSVFIFGYVYMGVQTTHDMNFKILVSDYLRHIQMLSIAKSAIQDETPFYIKCLTNYILIYSAINRVQVDVVDSALETPKLFAFPIDSLKDLIACRIAPILEEYQFPTEFFKMLYGSLVSMCFMLVYTVIQLVKRQYSKNLGVSSQSSIFNGFIYFQIFFLPSNMKNIIAGFLCREIAGDSYVKAEMTYFCFSEEHLRFMGFLVITFLVQCIMIPLYIFVDMRSINRDSPSARLCYGFLFVGYKKRFYMWEFVRIAMRVLIVVIVSSSSYEGKSFIMTAVIVLIMLLIYFNVVSRLKPNDRNKFNNLENISCMVLIFVLTMNIFIFNSSDAWIQTFGKFAIVCVHSAFLLVLICQIVLAKIQAKYGIQYNGLKGYLKREHHRIFSSLQFETVSQMRVYKNWKRLQEGYAKHKVWIDRTLPAKKKTLKNPDFFHKVFIRNERKKSVINRTLDHLSQTVGSFQQNQSMIGGQLASQNDISVMNRSVSSENKLFFPGRRKSTNGGGIIGSKLLRKKLSMEMTDSLTGIDSFVHHEERLKQSLANTNQFQSNYATISAKSNPNLPEDSQNHSENNLKSNNKSELPFQTPEKKKDSMDKIV